MSSTATAAKKQLKLILPKNSTGLIDGVFLRPNIDLDLNGSRLVKITNADYSGAGALTAKAAVLMAPRSKNGNTWYGSADNITVRNGILDANNKDCLAVLDLYNVRNFLCDGVTLITSQWSRNWATRGGGTATMLNGKILGQAGLFQDGAHWQYGRILWDNWYIEAGDDALAAGDDQVSSNANIYMDDVHLESFVARNIQVKSVRGAALKVYTAAAKPFSAAPNNYVNTGKVRGVDVQVQGYAGQLRNGGVSIFSHKPANSRTPDDLRDIRVHATLKVGTDGTSVWDAVSGVLVGNPASVSKSSSATVTLNDHGLASGQVVHLIPAKGGMLNLNGFYQVRPDNLSANTFELSDIAYRSNAGLNSSSFLTWTTGQLISVGSGTGYTVGDELTLSGGTAIRPAKWVVTQVNGAGAVEAVRRLDEGSYTILPSTPNSPTGGTGTGCVLHLFLEHDGTNAYGVKSYAGKNVTVTGEIDISDTTNANSSRFQTFQIVDSEGVRVECFFPKIPANGGQMSNESLLQLSKKNVINSRMIWTSPLNASMSPIMISNSADTLISGTIENVPSGGTAVAFPINGNVLDTRPIVAVSGATNATFQVAHGGWKAGQIVRIFGNVLSTGSLDGYYVIRRVYDNSSIALRALTGNPPDQIGLGAATVTTLGSIQVANNTVKISDLTVTPAPNQDNHIGVGAAATSPYRVSSLVIQDCNFYGLGTPISTNVQSAPAGYVARDNKV